MFVCLNREDVPPDFFVATASEVRPRIKEYPQPDGRVRGILNYGSLNTRQFKGRWDKVEAAPRKAVDRTG